MTSTGRSPRNQPSEKPDDPRRPRGGWLVLLVAVPVLCCAAPLLIATLGIGSLTTVIGVGTGQIALSIAGALAIILSLVIIRVRNKRR